MTYAIKDISVASGAPIEAYKFIGPFGIYRFTSDSAPITVAGEVYDPLPIVRTAIETGSVVDTIQTMDFVIPADTHLAKLYAFATTPRALTVEVRRVHRGDDYATDFKVEWIGEGVGYSTSGHWTTIQTGSVIQSKLSGNLSSVFYQRVCNHALYDSKCKVNKAAFTTVGTVTKIQNQIITVDNDGVANGVLVAGEVVNNRTGEVRAIISNTDNVLRIGYAFIDVKLGDTLSMSQGCNHLRLGDCKNKFANVPNYGGFDHIPEENPFSQLTNIDKVTTEINILKKYNPGFPSQSASY